MKELTKAEEQVMQVLWNINQGFVKDILDQLPEPKPAYNTVSTIVRILDLGTIESLNEIFEQIRNIEAKDLLGIANDTLREENLSFLQYVPNA